MKCVKSMYLNVCKGGQDRSAENYCHSTSSFLPLHLIPSSLSPTFLFLPSLSSVSPISKRFLMS